MRSFQTMGLAWPRPGIGVRHRTFSRVSRFHVVTSGLSSARPPARGPRNWGQSPALDWTTGNTNDATARIRAKATDAPELGVDSMTGFSAECGQLASSSLAANLSYKGPTVL